MSTTVHEIPVARGVGRTRCPAYGARVARRGRASAWKSAVVALAGAVWAIQGVAGELRPYPSTETIPRGQDAGGSLASPASAERPNAVRPMGNLDSLPDSAFYEQFAKDLEHLSSSERDRLTSALVADARAAAKAGRHDWAYHYFRLLDAIRVGK